jgi:hypothetical protein
VAHQWDPSPLYPVAVRLYTFATDEARTKGLAKWRAEAPKK